MEKSAPGEKLEELWNFYNFQRDAQSLEDYLRTFVSLHHLVLDSLLVDQNNELSHQNKTAPKELHHFPKDFLQVVRNNLLHIQNSSNALQTCDINLVNLAVQSLAIILRLKENTTIPPNLSTHFVGDLLVIATKLILLLRSSSSTPSSKGPCSATHAVGSSTCNESIEEFLHNTFRLFEILYDPACTWRLLVGHVSNTRFEERKDLKEDKSATVMVPLINSELIPFFYETLQVYNSTLSKKLQVALLHMFGAVICGRDGNAQLATSSTTLEILVK